MAPHSEIPNRENQIPDQEAHAGLASGRHSRVFHHKLLFRLEQWSCVTVCAYGLVISPFPVK